MMDVCIIGGGLVGLTLAKALVNQGIYVDIFHNQNHRINKSRTVGISKANIDFFNENILDIKKLTWDINKIEIYSENLKNEKMLNFQNKEKKLFFIVRNYELLNSLTLSLNKNKFFKSIDVKKVKAEKYRLIINCDINSFLTKKYFNKKFFKKYDSFAYTTIINHKKIPNKTAIQIFTKKGPLAFLPLSEFKTSVVYSVRSNKDLDIEVLIKKYNNKYSITRINQIFKFELTSSDLRTYYFQNILAFGDLLHKLHPLAGQGFNMTIRDIKVLVQLIKFKLDHGLDLDSSICTEFEKKIKHKNFIFSNSIDFIYEFFNFESKFENSLLSRSVQYIGKNKYSNKIFTKLADNGIVI